MIHSRTKYILPDLSLVAIWNFENKFETLEITRCFISQKRKCHASSLRWKESQINSDFVLIFCLTSKAMSGPLLDSFIILRDPRKRKGENIFLDQRRKKGKSDRKRPKRQLLVATALDWSLCLGRSGRCPGQQLPAFTTKFPPDFTSSPHFGSNFDPKHGDRNSI